MHNQTGNGQYICISGKCSKKPISFPNQPRLDKHKTCHASEKCEECGKIFGAKRNLKRHKKNKHQKEQAVGLDEDDDDGDKQNKIACFKVKLNWTRGSFFVFAP